MLLSSPVKFVRENKLETVELPVLFEKNSLITISYHNKQ